MLTFERDHLLNALVAVNRAVERRNTIPILSNCLISPGSAGARITGSDLDIEISVDVDADAKDFQGFTLPAATLMEIIKKFPKGGEVTIEPEKGSQEMKVSAGRSRFKLLSLPASDFPALAAGDMPTRFPISAKALAALIDGISFAISTEETRYYLNGIFMHVAENGIAMVATDGHRLAKREIEIQPEGEMPGVIIPRKTCGIIPQVFADGDLEISVSDAKIRFASDRLTVISKLIDGTYPDYQRVIPQNNAHQMTVGKAAFSAALERVSAVAGTSGRAVKLAITPNQIALAVNNPDMGSAEDTIECAGEAETEIGFNAKYLAEAAEHFAAEELLLELGAPGDPGLIRPLPDIPGALTVVMPMRV